jgi:phosphate transport system substrate-binding protein
MIVPAVVLSWTAAGCRQEAPPAARHLVLTGSSTMAPLVQEIGRRFEKDHPGVRIDVQAVGSARGVSDVQQGLSEIGMVARTLRPDESRLHAVLLARDGVCLVTSRANTVAALTDAQVIGLFSRVTANWKQVGGDDAPVTVVGLPEDRSLAQAFLGYYKLKPGQVRSDVVAGDGAQVLKAVAADPHAIGYAAVGPATEAAAGLGLRLLPCGDVPPTPAHVVAGSYPCTRPLLLVTREAPQGLAKEFLDYATSPAVRDLIEKAHEAPPGD